MTDLSRETQDVVDLTARLVAAPSVNPGGDEREVAGVVEDICVELGLPTPRRIGDPRRPNLVVDVDLGPGGRTLALSGHLDTKPVGDGAWETDPFVATVVDGDLRGRGVVDMKGALAAMLLAAADVAGASARSGRLSLVFCADEENGATHGAKWMAANAAPRADAMVIGEPGGIERDWDQLHLGSRGICNFDVIVTAEQAHSGLKDILGLVSATEVAARVLLELASFHPHVDGDAGLRPTLNPGVVIEGGTTYGVVPGRAVVASDCRLVPGMDEGRFLGEIRDLVAGVVPDGAAAQVKLRDWIPPITVDEDAEVVGAAIDALSWVLGEAPPPSLFPATTDATWFGALGIPTLPALGPGLLRHAHARNERISLASLGEARRLYGLVASSFCEVTG